jgi:hypothetical protein
LKTATRASPALVSGGNVNFTRPRRPFIDGSGSSRYGPAGAAAPAPAAMVAGAAPLAPPPPPPPLPAGAAAAAALVPPPEVPTSAISCRLVSLSANVDTRTSRTRPTFGR